MTSKDTPEQGANTNDPRALSSERLDKEKDSSPASAERPSKSPKKRRKVNHACLYCRRSHMTCDTERPCTRCIKRNIGHLCHDEEPTKKPKAKHETANGEGEESKLKHSPSDPPVLDPHANTQNAGLNLAPPRMPQENLASSASIGQSASVAATETPALTVLGYNEWNLGSQFHDMHNLHRSYMFNTSEVHNEYNLLSDFLTNSLMDDGALYKGDEIQGLFSDPSLTSTMAQMTTNSAMPPPSAAHPQQQYAPSQAPANVSAPHQAGRLSAEKAREKYYMTAADPSGTDTPEQRIEKLLKAKQDAGLLKPFNYIKGYERLNSYMKQNMQPNNKNRILRQLDKFRPQFRERMQKLSDFHLIQVEMWFEQSLMEYDRVFASMAIPACSWRRTGEIFRGNEEMADLINVPIENLRDGKIAIHEIIVEDSLANYWEKFGQIAFDPNQKAMLTSCSLKNPDPNSHDREIRCCFSFTIRRDKFNIPSLIVGNFLPIAPAPES